MARSDDKLTGYQVGVILVAAIAAIPLRLWATVRVYEWHVRSLVHGPEFSWVHMLMLSFFVGLLIGPRFDKSSDNRTASEKVGHSLGLALYPLLIVLTAWWLR